MNDSTKTPQGPQWYEVLFANYAKGYDREPFTQGTQGEVDFIEREAGEDHSKLILDIGCGTGRHSIELAKRGYKVTGIDLSEAQLKRAREKAREAGVTILFERRDAAEPHFDKKYDLALSICEGGFPLMETDEKNYAILVQAARALRPGGKFIFTTLNALFPLFHSVKDFMDANQTESKIDELSFDLMTFREQSELNFTDDNGEPNSVLTSERYYTPPELSWLLRSVGFQNIDIFGCELGNFSRERKLTTDDFEMLVIAEKVA